MIPYYLIESADLYLFHISDPRDDGYQGQVQLVDLDGFDEALDPDEGGQLSNFNLIYLGRNPSDPRQFCVFRDRCECQESGFMPLDVEWWLCVGESHESK